MRPRTITRAMTALALLSSVLVMHASPSGAAEGIITTYAGGGVLDGLPATQAVLWAAAVTTDAEGHLLIADSYHARVRRLESDNTLSTIAGNGYVGFGGDGGDARQARLRFASGV